MWVTLNQKQVIELDITQIRKVRQNFSILVGTKISKTRSLVGDFVSRLNLKSIASD